MSEYYVLDACALIAFLNDEAGADVVEELLRKSNHQEPNLFLHRHIFIFIRLIRVSGHLSLAS